MIVQYQIRAFQGAVNKVTPYWALHVRTGAVVRLRLDCPESLKSGWLDIGSGEVLELRNDGGTLVGSATYNGTASHVNITQGATGSGVVFSQSTYVEAVGDGGWPAWWWCTSAEAMQGFSAGVSTVLVSVVAAWVWRRYVRGISEVLRD